MLEEQQSQARDRIENTQARARERAETVAKQKVDDAMEEFGRMAFDALEERFPEQAKARRRPDRLQFLAAGFVAGFILRHFLRRRS